MAQEAKNLSINLKSLNFFKSCFNYFVLNGLDQPQL